MRFLARLILVPFGLGLAVAAGLLFLIIGGMSEPAVAELVAGVSLAGLFAFLDEVAAGRADAAAALLLGLWSLTIGVVVLPPLVVAVIGEIAGWRSYVWYGGATGVLTAAVPWVARGGAGAASAGELRITLVLFLTGVVAGFVYWLVAGRNAGADRKEAVTPSA
ncbi:hypothetical protein QNA08_16120 [Chelatococcus sp. SYSU_G07232]|uniref:Uncharacterized protein n=1 Tax=Chelatococcus albus TaxID=3047466 RepID=A0ABT7AK67_9HYPH|nr:hypothetical protein [Chelatococcus sp. SYSU_G07232]MDJ1159752.1 hypothetical protein [Chelatococcus sp. SYSU_G07232]